MLKRREQNLVQGRFLAVDLIFMLLLRPPLLFFHKHLFIFCRKSRKGIKKRKNREKNNKSRANPISTAVTFRRVPPKGKTHLNLYSYFKWNFFSSDIELFFATCIALGKALASNVAINLRWIKTPSIWKILVRTLVSLFSKECLSKVKILRGIFV